MSDVVIRVENLSKKYTIRHQANGKGAASGDGLRHALQDAITAPWRMLKSRKQKAESSISAFNSQLSTFPPSPPPSAFPPTPSTLDLQPSTSEDFYALKEVSFEVKRGEVLGIIGRNGAGKSTLLKILSRITEPSSGKIGIKGRIASLLEVGTGFHPELTGRENIFLNGAILGMSRAEVKRKFNEITAFAEIDQFIDTPVKRYSSGMYVRLAFSVAAHLDPDILIVDEVLAVGDAAFQRKCLGKMQGVASKGTTVLLVSHNMAAIQGLCESSILLQKGKLIGWGSIQKIVPQYLACEDPSAELDTIHDNGNSTRGGLIRKTSIKRIDGLQTKIFSCGEPIIIDVSFNKWPSELRPQIMLGIVIRTQLELPVGGVNMRMTGDEINVPISRSGTIRCLIQDPRIAPGAYIVDLYLGDGYTDKQVLQKADSFMVEATDFFSSGVAPLDNCGPLLLKPKWELACDH